MTHASPSVMLNLPSLAEDSREGPHASLDAGSCSMQLQKRYLLIPILVSICYLTYVKFHSIYIHETTQTKNGSEDTSHQRDNTPPTVFSDELCTNDFKEWFSSRISWTDELRFYTQNSCMEDPLVCPKGILLGNKVKVDLSSITLSELSEQTKSQKIIYPGGWWIPASCIPRKHVALIIPFRNREADLAMLMRHFIPILKRIADIHFRVFLVEHTDSHTFNRGKLCNIGFVESQKLFPFDCYIFHDVDLLAENDNIPFACEQSPMHLSVAIDKYQYKLGYQSLVTGVLMMTREHFEKVNGYSNSFWYWGHEADNMYLRLTANDLVLKRPPPILAQYKHVGKRVIEKKLTTHKFMSKSFRNHRSDGLNSLQYTIFSISDEPFFTRIQVDLQKDNDKLFGVLENFTNNTEY